MARIARITRLLLISKMKPATYSVSRLEAPSANFQTSVWGRPGLKDRLREKEANQKALEIKQDIFFDEQNNKLQEQNNKKDKKMFEQAIAVYLKRERARRRGHVEFIYAAMKRMKEFGVERDIQTYKKLMDVFPKAKMVAQNAIQVEFMHYPRQQQCCIDMLQQMEDHGVVPDDEMGYQVYYTFGKDTHAMRKYQRMMYWMPKFKNINPWPIPKLLPKDQTELAKIALKRMAVDIENQLATFWSETLPEAFDETWIVSAQSRTQRDLLAKHNSKNPIYVEGGFHVWTRYKSMTYFSLRADPEPHRLAEAKQFVKEEREKDSSFFDADKWKVFFEDEDLPNQVMKAPTAHEQEDGTYLAMCITGTASKDSLQSWIRFLQATNPKLIDTPVVFKLQTPESGIQKVDEDSEADTSVQMPGQYV